MRTLTVTGHGVSRAVPDVALVRVAAVHRARTLEEALAGSSSAAAVIGEVARRFTEPERIASGDLNVWPAHDHEGRAAGFEARHALRLRCGDLVAAGQLVGALAAEVGDRLVVESVGLEVGDRVAAEAAARELAFADARARADQLARLSGGTVGDVQEVVEGGVRPRPAAEAGRSLAATDVSFEPGEHEIGLALTVTFELV